MSKNKQFKKTEYYYIYYNIILLLSLIRLYSIFIGGK
jgi:hypothetical protein